jgi:hypothetical protein
VCERDRCWSFGLYFQPLSPLWKAGFLPHSSVRKQRRPLYRILHNPGPIPYHPAPASSSSSSSTLLSSSCDNRISGKSRLRPSIPQHRLGISCYRRSGDITVSIIRPRCKTGTRNTRHNTVVTASAVIFSRLNSHNSLAIGINASTAVGFGAIVSHPVCRLRQVRAPSLREHDICH